MIDRDSDMRILGKEESVTLLNSIEGRDRLAVMFGLHAGLRFGEVFLLEWADFNPDDGVLRIHNRKRDETVCVPLSEAVISELKTYIASSEGERLYEDQTAVSSSRYLMMLNKKFKHLLSGGVSFKTLRHTFLVNLATSGMAV